MKNVRFMRTLRPKGRFFWWKIACAAVLLVTIGFHFEPSVRSFSEWYWIMEQGDRGDDVAELQSRLRFLGFYGGRIDGVFGPGTRKAVIGFQKEFGLPADGQVGPQTKLKLAKATKQWNTSHMAEYYRGGGTKQVRNETLHRSTGRFNDADLKLLARAVYGEARGEPYIGQVAVAAVILNRLENPAFPDTVAGVIFQPRAFTAVDDGQIWLEPDDTAYKAVHDAINGWDPSGGAIYYFNPVTATSAWIWSRPQIKQIGKHIFCL
jgi:N-acetylmuramoyl-L-alanine amidase